MKLVSDLWYHQRLKFKVLADVVRAMPCVREAVRRSYTAREDGLQAFSIFCAKLVGSAEVFFVCFFVLVVFVNVGIVGSIVVGGVFV